MTKTLLKIPSEAPSKNAHEVCPDEQEMRHQLRLRVIPPPASPLHLPLPKILHSNQTPLVTPRRQHLNTKLRITMSPFCLLRPTIFCQMKEVVKYFHLHLQKWHDDYDLNSSLKCLELLFVGVAISLYKNSLLFDHFRSLRVHCLTSFVENYSFCRLCFYLKFVCFFLLDFILNIPIEAVKINHGK